MIMENKTGAHEANAKNWIAEMQGASTGNAIPGARLQASTESPPADGDGGEFKLSAEARPRTHGPSHGCYRDEDRNVYPLASRQIVARRRRRMVFFSLPDSGEASSGKSHLQVAVMRRAHGESGRRIRKQKEEAPRVGVSRVTGLVKPFKNRWNWGFATNDKVGGSSCGTVQRGLLAGVREAIPSTRKPRRAAHPRLRGAATGRAPTARRGPAPSARAEGHGSLGGLATLRFRSADAV